MRRTARLLQQRRKRIVLVLPWQPSSVPKTAGSLAAKSSGQRCRAEVTDQLLIPGEDMEISSFPPHGYLVLFSDTRLRDHAIAQTRGVDLDGATAHFIPWMPAVNRRLLPSRSNYTSASKAFHPTLGSRTP